MELQFICICDIGVKYYLAGLAGGGGVRAQARWQCVKGRGRQGSGGQPTPGAGQRDPADHGGLCVGQGAASGWLGPLTAPNVMQGGGLSPSRAFEELSHSRRDRCQSRGMHITVYSGHIFCCSIINQLFQLLDLLSLLMPNPIKSLKYIFNPQLEVFHCLSALYPYTNYNNCCLVS